MSHAAESLVDPLRVRQALSWQTGVAIPVVDTVPEDVMRSATAVTGDMESSDREAIVQFDLAGCRQHRVHVGHAEESVYVWIESAESGSIAEQFRVDIGAPFLGERAEAKMAYGVLTVRLPVRASDESGLHRRFG